MFSHVVNILDFHFQDQMLGNSLFVQLHHNCWKYNCQFWHAIACWLVTLGNRISTSQCHSSYLSASNFWILLLLLTALHIAVIFCTHLQVDNRWKTVEIVYAFDLIFKTKLLEFHSFCNCYKIDQLRNVNFRFPGVQNGCRTISFCINVHNDNETYVVKFKKNHCCFWAF